MHSEQQCLVRLQPGHDKRYIALSYVWGQETDPCKTLRSNITELSKPGAFDPGRQHRRLPPTVQDSLTLTRALGIELLWVDRFCIVQDDDESKPEQLAAMASIYANAYFTIAATEGSATTGLAGASPDRPRQSPYRKFQFTPECLMIDRNPRCAKSEDKVEEPYHTRGWTFQEWTVSRRLLVFHHQTVSWYCQGLIRQENGAIPHKYVTPTYNRTRQGEIWSSTPNIEAYIYHVREFTSRDLTCPGDVFAAFQATMEILGRCMKGRMLFGIPEMFFSALLLWSSKDPLSLIHI